MVDIKTIKENRAGIKFYSQWNRVVSYPLSIHLTWLCLKFGITANQATWVSLIAGVGGCVCIAFGNYWMLITGMLLIIVYGVLDCVDGNIARITKTASKYGRYLDIALGYVLGAFIPLSIGLSLYIKTGFWLYLIGGGICVASWLLGTTLLQLYNQVFGAVIRDTGSNNIVRRYIASSEVPILVGCCLFNYLELYLVFFTFIYIGRVFGIFYSLIKQR